MFGELRGKNKAAGANSSNSIWVLVMEREGSWRTVLEQQLLDECETFQQVGPSVAVRERAAFPTEGHASFSSSPDSNSPKAARSAVPCLQVLSPMPCRLCWHCVFLSSFQASPRPRRPHPSPESEPRFKRGKVLRGTRHLSAEGRAPNRTGWLSKCK